MHSKNDYSEDAKNYFLNEENKKKKKELKEKFGMEFLGGEDNAPPEIINKFLDNVKDFEEAWEKAESKKIIEILGFPRFRKAAELMPGELATEIAEVLAKYADHNINIDVIEKDDVSDEMLYKFLTEELPEEETDFMQIEGMTTNYIYEEFHPSNKLDAKDTIEWLAPHLFNKDKEGIKTYLSKRDLTFNGNRKSQPEFIDELLQLVSGFGKGVKSKIMFKSFEFELQSVSDAKVEVDFLINSKNRQPVKQGSKQNVLNLVFDLVKSEYGGFAIKGCTVK
jgi:hypothetical protein